jgi:nucleoside-diphosphate-sugar epimerase
LGPLAANCGNPRWAPPPAPPLATASAVSASEERLDKIVIFGGSGLMGPDVVLNLAPPAEVAQRQANKVFELRITDVTDRPTRRDKSQVTRSTGEARGSAEDAQTPETDSRHEYVSVDITQLEEVRAAAKGTDAMVVCSVSREHPVLAFEVNCRGIYNAVLAAVECGHRRFVNTGPWSVVGGHYRNWHHGLDENMPPQSGLDLYHAYPTGKASSCAALDL